MISRIIFGVLLVSTKLLSIDTTIVHNMGKIILPNNKNNIKALTYNRLISFNFTLIYQAKNLFLVLLLL